jgi:hypothetical protein
MKSRFARFAALPSAGAALVALLALAVTLALGPRPLRAAEQAASPAPGDAQAKRKADMEAYMKLAQPGEHHKRLANFAGNWTVAGKTWMEPGKPPTDFTGTVESSWLLGGRYLQSVHKGSFFGQPFEGRAIDGYDNATHEYFSTWIDNFGTGVEVFRGTCEDPCKALTETGEGFDPMAGKMVKSKEVTTFVDPDTYRFEMYMVGAAPDGTDVKVMELTAKRAK